jgi:hypothetical protein
MKHHITNAIFDPVRLSSTLTALLLLGFAVASAQGQVLSPSSLHYGLSYQEWSAKWWQWSLEQSTNHLELVGRPRIFNEQASRVQFLAGVYLPGPGGVTIATRKVSIPAETPLFFPILSSWDDNTGCPFTSFTAAELTAAVAGMWSGVTLTSCTIDGVAVPGLSNPATTEYLVQTPPFCYTTAGTDNVLAGFFGDTCIDGNTVIYPAVAEGVYLMLSPLKPGKHTINFVGQVGPYLNENLTYEITVE